MTLLRMHALVALSDPASSINGKSSVCAFLGRVGNVSSNLLGGGFSVMQWLLMHKLVAVLLKHRT
jgi:hypothetical protein